MPSRKREPEPLKWSDLSAGLKKVYADQGVTAPTFNKWHRMPQADRTDLTVRAKVNGYSSGLQFLAVQSAVKTKASKKKTITVATKPSTAATMLITGVKGEDNKRNRKLVAQLFNFDEFERVEWDNILSP